ncbi:MAG: recombinase family protein [Lachnospiraceae bacterium]|nr:recombinase family protein [Lachnospiraceae bacterium]
MSEKVYRTAIYARLSKDDGDKAESNSIVSQRGLCEEYITKHRDLELVETFVDDGYSGVDFNRPDFRRLEEAVRTNKIDAIVCKDLSRFSRNYIEGGRYLEKILPALGVRFIAINDNYDTLTGDPSVNSFIIPFKNLINDSYCKDISVKIRTNLDVKRRKGEFVGAYAPYGYKKDPENKNKLIVDEYAGDIVRKIFSMYKDGLSVCQIAAHLNKMGVLSPMEYKISEGVNYNTTFRKSAVAKWSYRAVKRILTNEVYIGVLAQGKRGTPNYKVRVVQNRDENKWIRVEDAHEALITHDDFMAIKTMLGRDMRSTGADSEDNLFSGFIYCADCGQPMTRKMVPCGNKRYYYYVCSTNKRHEGCTTHSISTREVETAVTNAVKSQISNVLDLSETLAYIDRMPLGDLVTSSYKSQITKLEKELDRCLKMKLRLYEDLSDGIINKEEYADFRNRYTAMIEDKTSALERVRREYEASEISGDVERAWITLFRKYEGINELDRRTLMFLVDKIFVYEKHVVEVSFKYKDEYQWAYELVKSNEDIINKNIDHIGRNESLIAMDREEE